jgi:ankyrin repeat protein
MRLVSDDPVCLQDGGTPLFVACQCGHMDVVEELIARGAKVNSHMKVHISNPFTANEEKYVTC